MNRLYFMVLALIIAYSSLAQQADLPKLKTQYNDAILAIETEAAKNQSFLLAAYKKDLQIQRNKTQAAGDLDKLKAILAEISRVQTEESFPTIVPEMSELKTLVSTYLQRSQDAKAGRAQRIVTLVSQYEKSLEIAQRKLTQEGKLDEATAIQAERKLLPETEPFASARNFLDEIQLGRATSASVVEKVPVRLPPDDVLKSFEVEALIDGNSELHITTTGLYWVSGGVSKPGRHNGRNEPTIVNGKEWFPVWGNPKEERGHDKTDLFPFRLRSVDLSLRLLAVSKDRGGRDIEERDAITTRQTEDEFVVVITDRQAGSRWYRFELTESCIPKSPFGIAKPPVHLDQNMIVEGEGWRRFRVGATREELIKHLGKPDNDPNDRWLQWKKKYSIHCLIDDARGAFELRFDNGFRGETTAGIEIGSTLKKALAAYGEPTTQEDRGGAKKLIWSSKGILIWFRGDKVNQIVVFQKN